jgi:hypothetical protein
MFHKVLQVYPTDKYQVYLYFSDGKIKMYDASELVEKGVFKKIKDKDIFINTCTVLNDTLAWDLIGRHDPTDCLDLDPEVLYKNCPEVNESDVPIVS